MSDTAKQDIVIVTPVYGPTIEELDRRFALHRLWEAKVAPPSTRRSPPTFGPSSPAAMPAPMRR